MYKAITDCGGGGLSSAVGEMGSETGVKVDLEKAQQYGIKPGDVRRIASTLVAGEEVGDIHIAHRTYDVNVWSVPESRSDLTGIRNLLID